MIFKANKRIKVLPMLFAIGAITALTISGSALTSNTRGKITANYRLVPILTDWTTGYTQVRGDDQHDVSLYWARTEVTVTNNSGGTATGKKTFEKTEGFKALEGWTAVSVDLHSITKSKGKHIGTCNQYNLTKYPKETLITQIVK